MSCPSCLSLLRFPVTLGCGHAMCKVCILAEDGHRRERQSQTGRPSHHRSGRGGAGAGTTHGCIDVTCRICSATSTFTSEAALVVDARLQGMLDVLQGAAAEEAPCMRCEAHAAVAWCEECRLSLCADCNALVHVGRLRTHRVTSPAAAGSSLGPSSGAAFLRPEPCDHEHHAAYPKDLYCADCRTFLCVVCAQSLPTHKHHQVMPAAEAAKIEQPRLTAALAAAEAFRAELRVTVAQIDAVADATAYHCDEEIAVFERSVDELVRQLTERKAVLVAQARRESGAEVAALRDARDRIFRLASKLNESCAEGHKAVRHRASVGVIRCAAAMEENVWRWDPIVVPSAACPTFHFDGFRDMTAAVSAIELRSTPVTALERGVAGDRLNRTLEAARFRGDALTTSSSAAGRQLAVAAPQSNRSLLGDFNGAVAAHPPSQHFLASPSAAPARPRGDLTDPHGGVLIDPAAMAAAHRSRHFAFHKSTFGGLEMSNSGRTLRSRGRNGGADGRREPGWETALADLLLSSGHHYFELVLDAYDPTDGHDIIVGVVFDGDYGLCDVIGEDNNSAGLDLGQGTKCIGGAYDIPYTSRGAFRTGDVVGVALDFDAQTLSFYRNGCGLGIAFSGLCRPCYAAVSLIQDQQVTVTFPMQRPL